MQSVKKHWLKEYFTFTAKERRAVLLLVSGAVLFALLPKLFPFLVKEESVLLSDPALEQMLLVEARLEKKPTANNAESLADMFEPRQQDFKKQTDGWNAPLFYFNPNTATEADWKKLGVREKTIQTILKYRSKGGVFRKPEDLGKIYGMHPAIAERLRPYVRIELPSATVPVSEASPKPSEFKSNPPKATLQVNINTADPDTWQKLNGIGPAYARRIVGFREKLGGFLSVEQVAETFGLPDSTFQKIKTQLVADANAIRKININAATLEELKAHPYIGWRTAKNIIEYRNQHGEFSSVATILKIGSIDESLFAKISPYLTVE